MLAAVQKGRGTMSRRIIVLVLVAGALAGTASTGANASSNLQAEPRIIGGGPDPFNDTKWVAALDESGVPGLQCGGSLYAPRLVLTAAHCTAGTRPWQWTVRLGSKSWNSGGVVRRVTRIHRYPGYNPATDSGDLAVLQLSQSVAIPPVSLVPSRVHYVANPPNPAYIFGWGAVFDYDHGFPRLLRSTWVWLRQDGICHSVYREVPYDPYTEICAGRPGQNTCDGDSGGPLAVWRGRWQLVGVTSWGGESSCRVGPSVYAWVGSPPLHRWLTGS
jgi:secreted trypsin-like serine protease